MASLRDTVKQYQEELRDGIAWVAFWREGRSWNGDYFYLEANDALTAEDKSRLEEIRQKDPAAVMLNSYYCGYLGEDMTVDELTAGVRRHYENGYNSVADFIEAHDDTLPPEVLEEARQTAHAAGLPFHEKSYDGEDIDPYVYDGHMSMEDYDLMHKMIAQERSENRLNYSSFENDRLEAADRLKIERSIYFESGKADISALTALPLAELIRQREESAAAEQAIFEALKQQAAAWEAQAGNTLTFDKAIEYARTPAVTHTENQWKADENNNHTIINSIDGYLKELQQERETEQTAALPDPTIQISDMQEYGYTWDGMLPLQQEAAERLFHEDLEIFCIYEDGTEGAVTSLSELREHAEKGGLFGVEKVAWEAFYERTADKAQEETKATPELPQEKDTFSIYQLKLGDETTDLRFEPYDRLTATGHTVDMANYDRIYTADLAPGTSLEDIYTRFNVDHPKDFKGHSLSVSDVVVLHQNGQDTAHYVDSIGYKEVPEFLKQPENPLKHVEDTIEQNDNNFDGIINNTPTVDELEKKAKSGEQISLTDLADAIKADRQRGKGKEEKPSIRAQLKAEKQRTAQKKTRTKSQDLERS